MHRKFVNRFLVYFGSWKANLIVRLGSKLEVKQFDAYEDDSNTTCMHSNVEVFFRKKSVYKISNIIFTHCDRILPSFDQY